MKFVKQDEIVRNVTGEVPFFRGARKNRSILSRRYRGNSIRRDNAV